MIFIGGVILCAISLMLFWWIFTYKEGAVRRETIWLFILPISGLGILIGSFNAGIVIWNIILLIFRLMFMYSILNLLDVAYRLEMKDDCSDADIIRIKKKIFWNKLFKLAILIIFGREIVLMIKNYC